jgi:hypothetical protein
MTAAAIAAQLVDIRNVGTHKSLKLTIHVPEEQALAAIAAFGWPTGVNPVPIAIARLEVMPPAKLPEQQCTTETPPRQEAKPSDGAKTKTAFRDMRLPNQAGIMCDTPAFQKFIAERNGWPGVPPERATGRTADYVRRVCNVASRADIRPRTPSGDRWLKLFDEYKAWLHAPECAA